MALFKKKEPETMTTGKGAPIDRVKDLSTRGFSEPDMIEVLRKEGYNPEEIDSALTEALKEGVGVAPPVPIFT
jgi:hypothetical protein